MISDWTLPKMLKIAKEEEKFRSTLSQGLREFEKLLKTYFPTPETS